MKLLLLVIGTLFGIGLAMALLAVGSGYNPALTPTEGDFKTFEETERAATFACPARAYPDGGFIAEASR